MGDVLVQVTPSTPVVCLPDKLRSSHLQSITNVA